MNILRKSRYHLNPTNVHSTFNNFYPIPILAYYYSAISSSGSHSFHLNFSYMSSKCDLLFNSSNGSNSIFQSDVIFNRNMYIRRFTHCSPANKLAAADSTVTHVNDSGSNKVAAAGSTVIHKISPGSSSNTFAKKGGNSIDDEVSPIVIANIVEIVKNDTDVMESRLDLIALNLSIQSIIEVFRVLNELKVPALRFFNWIRNSLSKYSRNADLCSLAIDNCGRLGDFSAMRSLLIDFRDRKISLSDKAFGFLNISNATNKEAKKSITEIVRLLNEVGGSCCNSGIPSLISMLCSLNSLDLTKFVLEITEKRASHYNILVKHMCVQGKLTEAQNTLLELSQLGINTNSTAYNYLISSLCVQGRIDEACSIPNKMIDTGCSPDHLSYEILIYFTCRYGRSDDAMHIYNEMLSRGIKPRLPTFSAFIRGYVSAQHFDEAYRYVVDGSTKNKWSASHMYNVLASLHIDHGNVLVAHKLILEMVEKGLNPKPSVSRRVSKCLRKMGRSLTS